MNAQLVSVVIPAFNASHAIRTAVESALCQTHRDVEVLVADDGSTDDTARVVSQAVERDSRVRLIQGEENLGAAGARNRGLAQARGSFIAFLDADDEWLPQKLEVQLAALLAAPDIAGAGSRLLYRSASGRSLGISGEAVDDAARTRIASGRLMPFPISSLLVRADAARAVGNFDETAGINGFAEDLDYVSRLAAHGRVLGLADVLGYYRVHGGSQSVRVFHGQRLATRFVRARHDARAGGGDLTWSEFQASFRLSWAQRRGDQAGYWYRTAGLRFAERRVAGAVGFGMLALAAGPRYTIRRAIRQRALRAAR